MTNGNRARLCYVIMPFSSTKRCTEAEWTEFFTDILKPAIEGLHDLGYECRRSTPMRGNLVRGILEDLQSAHVVIADLTDRNSNVFYELGVRHTLTDRTILISQDRDDIPFDLASYANHVYDWKTEVGQAELTKRLHELLREIDERPDRPDNPVSDFLGGPKHRLPPSGGHDRMTILEEQVASLMQQAADRPGSPAATIPRDPTLTGWLQKHSLTDELPKGRSIEDVLQALSASNNPILLKALTRNTERALIEQLRRTVASLNNTSGGAIELEKIVPEAETFISKSLPIVAPLEEFALTCVSNQYEAGVRSCVHIAAELITLTEHIGGGLRFAVGIPSYLGWRLLLLMGAKAIDIEDLGLAGIILNEPLEVRLLGGQFSYKPLWAQRKLFFPEVFLGYANLGMKSLDTARSGSLAIEHAFPDDEAFRNSLTLFVLLVALRHSTTQEGAEVAFYPGYRLLTGSRDALRKFGARMRAYAALKQQLASALELSLEQFTNRWPELAQRLNRASLGSSYIEHHFEPDLPLSLAPEEQ